MYVDRIVQGNPFGIMQGSFGSGIVLKSRSYIVTILSPGADAATLVPKAACFVFAMRIKL